MKEFANGVNCTMLAPYTPENQIDYRALEAMLHWYVQRGCSSFFAMCHSTELHCLTMRERLGIVRFTSQRVKTLRSWKGAVPGVIAAGTFSTGLNAMADEIQAVSRAGADAVVLITNKLDPEKKGTAFWQERAARLLELVPKEIPLGLYECPFPYKYVLSLEEIKWALATRRFYFIKDTCCDPEMLKMRLDAVRGSPLKLFNANAQTLLYTLREGAAGYSSVMANIHPQLYAWLCESYAEYPEIAEHLQHILCFTSLAEQLSYPLIAKYVMRRQGVPVELRSRMRDMREFTPYHAFIMDQLMALTQYEYARLPGAHPIGD